MGEVAGREQGRGGKGREGGNGIEKKGGREGRREEGRKQIRKGVGREGGREEGGRKGLCQRLSQVVTTPSSWAPVRV